MQNSVTPTFKCANWRLLCARAASQRSNNCFSRHYVHKRYCSGRSERSSTVSFTINGNYGAITVMTFHPNPDDSIFHSTGNSACFTWWAFSMPNQRPHRILTSTCPVHQSSNPKPQTRAWRRVHTLAHLQPLSTGPSPGARQISTHSKPRPKTLCPSNLQPQTQVRLLANANAGMAAVEGPHPQQPWSCTLKIRLEFDAQGNKLKQVGTSMCLECSLLLFVRLGVWES